MNYPSNVWKQLKGLTSGELMSALQKDGWNKEPKRGSVILFVHPDGRDITIHFHPKSTYRPKLLRAILDRIGWNEGDMRRLKLIK